MTLARPTRRNGRFVNPWPVREPSRIDLLRWGWQRRRAALAPDPPPAALPRALSAVARPHARHGELRLTWVGHATFLIQIDGWNLLTDPHWSERASPLPWAGPKRFSPPGLDFAALPRIDAVLLSHDHYDHLDDTTVRRIARRCPEAAWFAPLGYRAWLRSRGVRRAAGLDWWQQATTRVGRAELRITALPAQHWTSRGPTDRRRRLWCGWCVRTDAGRSVYFAGDSGYSPAFREIGRENGPFDAVMLPIGAYEPRWFMRAAHMNPEEAVRAYLDLGGRGLFTAMHWGTWRLTDEDPLEPPVRARRAWRDAGLAPDRLWVPAHGETRRVAAPALG
jgi:N-acyl-phosphatidylethanolamine-hydrolysing phospholipase D